MTFSLPLLSSLLKFSIREIKVCNVFEPQTATGRVLFSYLTYITFTLTNLYCEVSFHQKRRLVSWKSGKDHCPGMRNVHFRFPFVVQKKSLAYLSSNHGQQLRSTEEFSGVCSPIYCFLSAFIGDFCYLLKTFLRQQPHNCSCNRILLTYAFKIVYKVRFGMPACILLKEIYNTRRQRIRKK